MPENSYRKSWSRQFRGLLVFLLDQSASMQEPVQLGRKSYINGQIATTAINDLIISVINNAPLDLQIGGHRDYCDILVLGYGDQVTHLVHDGHGRPVSIRDLDAHPKGHHMVLVERFDTSLNKPVPV